MRTIAIVNQKGGSGKTAIATSLAVAAQEAGEKVALLDLDPQQSSTAWGADREADMPVVEPIPADRLPQLPALLDVLKRKGFTLVVLDTPPLANATISIAMKAADLCLVPSPPTRVSIRATKPTVDTLKALKREFAFIITMNAWNENRANEAANGLSVAGWIASPVINFRADYQDAYSAGKGVTEYSPRGKAADEMRRLWAWSDKRTGVKAELWPKKDPQSLTK